MGNRKRIYLLGFLGLFATAASAQSTLGDILDKGFKMLSKAEFVAAVHNIKISSVRADGVELEYSFQPDGSFGGTWYSSTGMANNMGQGNFSGTWSVEDDGKVCTSTMSRGGQTTTCGYWFRNGDQYYASSSATDRAAAAGVRTFKK